MPIDWKLLPDPQVAGDEMLELMHQLFPIPRSLTGFGVRDTLAILGEQVPIEVTETPSGTEVFDWVIPREWTIRGGWIEELGGRRLLDSAESSLHVIGHSAPVDAVVTLEELREHVSTHPDDPSVVPYRSSYYEERWGFNMTQDVLDSLTEPEYHVVIDSTLAHGSLTSGEARLRGSSTDEFLLSTYICHPSLANDNLSGVVLLWSLARALAAQQLRYTYRLLWSPATLGPLCWLSRNLATVERVRHGLAIACVGDPGPLRYKRSRRGDAMIDRVAAHVLGREPENIVTDWEPRGGDERQFCAPAFDLPVGAFSRTPHGEFPEYHSSADDLDFVTADALGASLRACLEIIAVIEDNASFRNLVPYGEPQLGKRGLYSSLPDGANAETALLWVLSLVDVAPDLLTIAERSGLPFEAIRDAAGRLEETSLLERLS